MAIQPIALKDVPEPDSDEAAEALLPRDMDLVRSVPVTLSVCAGRVSMSIEDLFALKKGSVLTLDAHVDEPLVLYVDKRPVARGTLMAVDDRFGIRITEIL